MSTLEKQGPLYWTGMHALRGGVERMLLRFSPTTARAIRLEPPADGPSRRWWVHELRVFGADDGRAAS